MAYACNSEWPAERVAKLRKLWAEGLSASQIAKRLACGVSRSAVLGKVHRLQLPKRIHTPAKETITNRVLSRMRPPKRVAAPPAPISEPAVPLDPIDPTLTTLRLNEFTCRYPIGDPQDAAFTYCGRTCEGPYCRDHKRLCYQRPLPKSRSVENLVRAELRREQWVAAR